MQYDDTDVLICLDEDVAYVGSINNRPKRGPFILLTPSEHNLIAMLQENA